MIIRLSHDHQRMRFPLPDRQIDAAQDRLVFHIHMEVADLQGCTRQVRAS